ncbi:MAG: GtrA family protein [Firmicutes bacterium]|jgi:putative flippase GtrA|uniref:GtrA family protein n=1 Tax=Sulfobacillus benefaciens TaxID=453960 RepID=A0A2T2X813_9FIRM|nr:GtrA family protein [Bacillota bacterium]MCL5014121.1 GtrA family protein [Bacillota bacterium]PSR30596.1 MAG: GtrA family protein [Sulfobacillus benefaciens]HBQ95565.1 GtrA family protein [Sulfobacillus sp.]
MRRLWQFSQFVSVGLGNAFIDLLVFNGLYWLFPTRDVDQLVVYNTVAVMAAISNSYIWNTRWTFRKNVHQHGKEAIRQRTLFVIQSLINIVVNDLILWLIAPLVLQVHMIPHVMANNIAKLAAMFLASLTSFIMMKLVVFT